MFPGPLSLSPISVKEDYAKEWNITMNDFVCLTKNGDLLRSTLYRVGGLLSPILNVDKYFTLIKYSEAFYPKHITTRNRKHLQGAWCIIDKEGNEKVTFKPFETPYLVKNSCIYHMRDKYYNIETGECYCSASAKVESSEFLFLENRSDEDKAKCGVMKINKSDGRWELFL